MCTASWLRGRDGYVLFFNRDEQRSRAIGRPPRALVRLGVRVLAPEDAKAGGSWIGVNEHGVTVGLLNGPQAWRRHASPAPSPAGTISRGLLLASLLDAASLRDVDARIAATPLAPYLPFTVVAAEPSRPVTVWAWDDGLTHAHVERSGLIATSSSVDGQSVRDSRARLFERLAFAPDLVALRDLHRSHLPTAGAHSVCMHRSDAETVSMSRIDVTPEWVALEYTPGAPCHNASPGARRLARVEAGATI
jgi:hypothetical protein